MFIGACCYCKNQVVASVHLIGQCTECVETRYLQVFPMNNGHFCESWLGGWGCMHVFACSSGILPDKIEQAVQNEILKKHKGRPASCALKAIVI